MSFANAAGGGLHRNAKYSSSTRPASLMAPKSSFAPRSGGGGGTIIGRADHLSMLTSSMDASHFAAANEGHEEYEHQQQQGGFIRAPRVRNEDCEAVYGRGRRVEEFTDQDYSSFLSDDDDDNSSSGTEGARNDSNSDYSSYSDGDSDASSDSGSYSSNDGNEYRGGGGRPSSRLSYFKDYRAATGGEGHGQRHSSPYHHPHHQQQGSHQQAHQQIPTNPYRVVPGSSNIGFGAGGQQQHQQQQHSNGYKPTNTFSQQLQQSQNDFRQTYMQQKMPPAHRSVISAPPHGSIPKFGTSSAYPSSSSTQQKQTQHLQPGKRPVVKFNPNDVPCPTSLLVVGGAGSGKTTFLWNVASFKRERYDYAFIWSLNPATRRYCESITWPCLIVDNFNETFILGVLAKAELIMETFKADGTRSSVLMIFDDMLTNRAYKNSNVWGELLKRSHHSGISVWCAVHSVMDIRSDVRPSFESVAIAFTTDPKLRDSAFPFFEDHFGTIDKYHTAYNSVVPSVGKCMISVTRGPKPGVYGWKYKKISELRPFTLLHPNTWIVLHMFRTKQATANIGPDRRLNKLAGYAAALRDPNADEQERRKAKAEGPILKRVLTQSALKLIDRANKEGKPLNPEEIVQLDHVEIEDFDD